MSPTLRFGTAGIRGALGEGPQHMNAELIELAATAIAEWLPPASSVIIGRDARHGSEAFANVIGRVLKKSGHHPRSFSEPVPTPLVAYAVGSSDAAAGVMITASHNPATDNGLKVYTADGGQLLPDDAAIIEEAMAALPWPGAVDTSAPAGVDLLGPDIIEGYLRVITVAAGEFPTAPSGIVVAYSAMHGVGGALFERALSEAGHQVRSVPEQHQPNPDFPTAPFPNPEEPGTLELVRARADAVGADIVLANDPDADRLAVSIRMGSGWQRLTGDQIGVLLGWYVLQQTSLPCTVSTSVVSSTLLGKLTVARGARHRETLTGFKWLARAGDSDAPLAFAYEEALGYAVVPVIKDKDGISAGLAFANLVAWLQAHDRSVNDVLAEIGDEFGHHLNTQVSVRFVGSDATEKMSQLMRQLRAAPPDSIGAMGVVSIDDLAVGQHALGGADVVIFNLENGRLIIRPSGTEPKVKGYLEVIDENSLAADGYLKNLASATEALLG